jgi:anti-sigma regulatory factor (Ser/Thr protein kinase)
MLNSVVETVIDGEVGATINLDLASYAVAEVEVVSDSPYWIELRVPGEMKAVLTAEKMLALFAAGIASETREAIMAAFRELLENAIEHGCRLDKSKSVGVRFVRLKRAVFCQIKDPGKGFDPTQMDHAAVNNPADEPLRHARLREEKGIRAGGYGLLLTTRLVDELVYNEQHNEVVFVKYLA